MWKKYKTTLILTTLISLFPMVIGLLLWNRMPDTIATHFGTNNVPNGWSSKTMAVIGIPLFLAALQIFTAVLTFSDPKRQNIGPKMIRLVLWIIPVTSLIVCCSIYANAVGIAVDIGFVSQWNRWSSLYSHRQLHAKMQTELHNRHQGSMDPSQSGKLEPHSPPRRLGLDHRRRCHDRKQLSAA